MNYISRFARNAAAIGVTALLSATPTFSANSTYNPAGVEYGQRSVPAQKPAPKPAQAPSASLAQNNDAYFRRLRTSRHLNSTDRLYMTAYDIDTGERLVSINEDSQVMAASTIKDFVMLAYYDQVQRGAIRENSRDNNLIRAMIQRSRNSETNQIINRIGGPARVESILSARYPYFNETDIIETIPRDGRTYRNKTSTHDLNIFDNQLWHNGFPLRRDLQEKMKSHLAAPKTDRLFDKTCIPKGMQVWNKTGTVYGQVSDSGILRFRDKNGKYHQYALSIVIEDPTKTNPKNRVESLDSWRDKRAEVIRSISEGVYDYMATRYNGGYMCKQHKGVHLGGRQ